MYRFSPEELTKETRSAILSLGENGWYQLFRDLMSYQPLSFSLSFPENEPITRLIFSYDLCEAFQLDPEQNFRKVTVKLLTEWYGRPSRIQEAYELITLMDYIKAGPYYQFLERLVTNRPAAEKQQGPDRLSLQYKLINAIMAQDINRSLYPYLVNKNDRTRPPEYYQVTIRYILNYKDQQAFDHFMNKAILWLEEAKDLSFIFTAFKEYVHYKNNFTHFYEWLMRHHDELSAKSNHALNHFTDAFLNWFSANRTLNENNYFYYQIYTYLYSFNLVSDSFYLKLRKKMDLADGAESPAHQKLAAFLGKKQPELETVSVPVKTTLDDFMIPEYYVKKSEQYVRKKDIN